MKYRALVLCLLSSAIGCDDEERRPREESWTSDAFCAALAQSICSGLSVCECRFDVRPYDDEGCVAARSEQCQDTFGARVQPDVDAGRVRFAATAVDECLLAIGELATTCTLVDDGPLPEVCDRALIATADLDVTCDISGLAYCAEGLGLCVPGEGGSTCRRLPGSGAECLAGFCAPGLTCKLDPEGGPSACATPGVSGTPCLQGSECQVGLVCLSDGTCGVPRASTSPCQVDGDCALGLSCALEVCTEAPALGEGCTGPNQCGSGRACERAPETRTCTAPDQEGEPCSDGTCDSGFLCDPTSNVCVMLPGDGQACLEGFYCADGLTCVDGEGVCAPLPTEGDPCASGATFCASGFGCRESDWTCQPAASASEGEGCLLNPPDYVCAEGLGCDFGVDGSICIPKTGVGGSCSSDRTCTAETYCASGTCVARLVDGSPCSDGNECQPTSECVVVAGAYRCTAIPAENEPCFADCSDGLVCKGPGGQCAPAFCVVP